MCFYNDDYDWIAEDWTVTEGPTPEDTRCCECGEPIPAGQWVKHVWMQQYAQCQRCEEWELEEGELPCEKCDYGEDYEYDCCESCEKVLKAIEAQEEKEGCPKNARRPGYGGLGETLSECEEYASLAIEMFPELAAVPFVQQYLEPDDV